MLNPIAVAGGVGTADEVACFNFLTDLRSVELRLSARLNEFDRETSVDDGPVSDKRRLRDGGGGGGGGVLCVSAK